MLDEPCVCVSVQRAVLDHSVVDVWGGVRLGTTVWMSSEGKRQCDAGIRSAVLGRTCKESC